MHGGRNFRWLCKEFYSWYVRGTMCSENGFLDLADVVPDSMALEVYLAMYSGTQIKRTPALGILENMTF